MMKKNLIALSLMAYSLLCLTSCLEEARNAIPFLPQPKYTLVGGRKMTRAEVAYYQKIKDLSYATKVNPRDAVAYNTLGELFQKKGFYSLAKDLYLKAILIDDTLSEVHHNLGLIYLYEDRYSGAFDELTKARALSPDDARIRHRLGLAKAGLGRIAKTEGRTADALKYEKESLKEYDEAIALDAEYTPAYLEKARALFAIRRYAEATTLCRTALAKAPKINPAAVAKETHGNGLIDKILPTGQTDLDEEVPKTYRQEAAYDLALCLKAQGLFSEALTVLIQAEDTPLGAVDVQVLKARLQDAAGNVPAAIITLQTLKEQFPNRAEILKRLARLYQKSGQTELSAKTRLEAAELDQSDRELQEEAALVAERQKDTARAIAIYERLVRIAPEELRYRRQLAKAYDNAGITRQAALAYLEVVKRDPSDAVTQRRLAILYSDIPGFQGSAIPLFKKVLEKNPADAEAHRRMGELYLESNNRIEAEKHIRETIRYTPNDAKAHNNLATLYGKQNRFDDAIQEYKKALALEPQYLSAQLNLPKVYLAVGRREEAVDALRAYLKQKPTDQQAIALLADALRDLGRREEAIAEYEALDALRSNDSVSKMNLAKLTNDLGKGRSAAGIYEQIIEKNPTDLNALKEAGRLYVEMKIPLRAIFCWQRVLALKPGDLEGQKRLADCYQQIGSDEAAIKAYEIVGKNGDADAWKNVAALRFKHDERELALQALRESIKINPQEKEARTLLAASLQSSEHLDEHDEALRLNQELIQLDSVAPDQPKNPNQPSPAKNLAAHLNLANLLSEYNRFSEAQDEYDFIVREKPNHSQALLGLGVLWRKKAQYAKAADYYTQALKAESDKKNPDPKVLRSIHFNLGVVYDYYIKDKRDLAQDHYRQYVELGGDPKKIVSEEKKPVEPAVKK